MINKVKMQALYVSELRKAYVLRANTSGAFLNKLLLNTQMKKTDIF